MASQGEIHDLLTYLQDLYMAARGEQAMDELYYNDVFAVPQIKNKARLSRTGRASRLVDSPAEHIITSNPQVFRFPTKDTDEQREASLSVANETNRWVSIMKRQNPNPFKEFVKDTLLYGEAWIHPLHNEKWVTGKKERRGLPVLFTLPNPRIIYADPNEDENGIPERVIVYYERQPSIIRQRYPEWKNGGKIVDGRESNVIWLEYWDKDQVYFEADGVVVHDADNIYGFVPFVHKLSGFGKSSAEGRMEDLVVGRLRKVRDILVRECAIVSDIDSIFHLFSNRSYDFQRLTADAELPDGFLERYIIGPGQAHEIPYGIEVKPSEQIMPEPQLFQYLASIKAELEHEDPLVMAGSAVGSTGRQQDMVMGSAMRRYDTIVENTEYAFATAIGMGLEMCEDIPKLCPKEFGLEKEQIKKNYEVLVALKADDPLESDRKATLGSRLYQQGEIDLRTNLIKYQNYTENEAEEIITNMLVDKVIFQSPEIAELIGLKAAEKLGITDELNLIRQRAATQGKSQQALQQSPMAQPGQAEMTQRTGEVGSGQGRELIDMALASRGQRSPPSAYTRGS